jgi:hypothetical protein
MKKKKMIYDIDANELMEKSFKDFIEGIEKANNEDPELKNFPMPQSFKDMLQDTYEAGFVDGCIHIGKQIQTILEGDATIKVNVN